MEVEFEYDRTFLASPRARCADQWTATLVELVETRCHRQGIDGHSGAA